MLRSALSASPVYFATLIHAETVDGPLVITVERRLEVDASGLEHSERNGDRALRTDGIGELGEGIPVHAVDPRCAEIERDVQAVVRSHSTAGRVRAHRRYATDWTVQHPAGQALGHRAVLHRETHLPITAELGQSAANGNELLILFARSERGDRGSVFSPNVTGVEESALNHTDR